MLYVYPSVNAHSLTHTLSPQHVSDGEGNVNSWVIAEIWEHPDTAP